MTFFSLITRTRQHLLLNLLLHYSTLMQVELNKVKVKVLDSILLQQILIPHHVAQIYIQFVAKCVFNRMSISIKNTLRPTR